MQVQTARRIKIAVGFLFAIAALPLAGCGNHDQAGTSGGSGTMTPAQVQQNAQQQNQAPAGAQTAPAANAAPGNK